MAEMVSVKTVPNRCPHCRWPKAIRLVSMPPEVEPTFRFLPITQVVEIGGRVVLGLGCHRCGGTIAEGERPLSLKVELRHDGQCPGAPDILELEAEPFQNTDSQNRRHDGANITILAGCSQCSREVTLQTAVALRRNEYDEVYRGDHA